MVTVNTSLKAGSAVESADIDAWLESVAKTHGGQQLSLLRDACLLVADVYGDIRNEDGESLMRHALSVADILEKLDLDEEALTAAILNGALDQRGVTRDDLEERFGEVVAQMVEDLARINHVVGGRSAGVDEMTHAENLRRLLLGIAEDVRVVLVVVAERLHRMRLRKKLTSPAHRQFARETLDIYAPLANRLGIWHIKWEMEDLCLRCLEPDEYTRIASLLDERRQDRESGVAHIARLLDEKLNAMGIEGEIKGRPKHIYSIWQKMKRKDVGFDQIFDVRAVRVLVNTVTDCYAALGVVHGLWQNIPGEFDDYIASPKTNLYQSLHTAVIGPEKKPVEIQIRTRSMHYHSEMGVAAHWRYKEDSRQDSELERRVLWMRRWLDMKDAAGAGTKEFVESFKAELEPAQIYVLTPQARVVELPKGSTPLDFAYAIHSDVGHRCRGARVNGRIVQLTRTLHSGETVEILTTKEGGPSRDWLSSHVGYLHSARARNRVRQWFKREDYDQHVQKGRTSLEREVGRLNLQRPDLDEEAVRFNFKKADDLLAAIGRGEVSPGQVSGATARQLQPERTAEAPVTHKRPTEVRGDVAVAGVDDLMTHMARCCKPVPNDSVVGFITRGRGVTVHRRDCPNVVKLKGAERERLVDVAWTRQSAEGHYPVDVLVRADDRKGLLRDVSTLITSEDVDVVAANTVSDRKMDVATMKFTVVIVDVQQLGLILDKIAQLPGVIEVRRQL